MSNLCELCGKEAMGGTYQMRTGLLNVCAECSGLYVERLDAVAGAAWASEIEKIKAENTQVIKDNKVFVLSAQRQELMIKMADIDGELDTISKPMEIIK